MYAWNRLTMRQIREFELTRACAEDQEPVDVVMVFLERNAYTQGGVHQLPPSAVREKQWLFL